MLEVYERVYRLYVDVVTYKICQMRQSWDKLLLTSTSTELHRDYGITVRSSGKFVLKNKGGGGGLSGVPYPLSPIPLRFSLPSQQATARIILAQRSCHIAITAKLAFLSIRNVQVHNYYTSPWLNFEVLGLDGDLTQTFDQPSFFIGEISLLVVCFTSLSDFSFNLVLKRCTCHVIFHCFTRSHINIRSFSNIKKMKFSKLRL